MSLSASVVAVGTELLGDDRLDTNSLRIAALVRSFGVPLVHKAVVGDDVERLARTLQRASEEAGLVVVTGGLGPTRDDLTREASAILTGRALKRDAAVLQQIKAMYRRRGAEMPVTNARQADVLEGSVVLPNELGTAPGLCFEHNGSTFFLLPGVPGEADGLLATAVRPWLSRQSLDALPPESELRVACLPESLVEERLMGLYEAHGSDGVAILAKPGEVLIRLSASSDAERHQMVESVRLSLGDAVFAVAAERGGSSVLEQVVVDAARVSKAGKPATIATAESCTGGWIGQRLTAVAGSSAVYAGGIIAYSNEVKIGLLDVEAKLIVEHGAVSEPVAEAMAVGARHRLATDWAVSVTGVAGPGGGTKTKPVGMVWFGIAGAERQASRCLIFPGDRERVRLQASQYALDMLRRELLNLSPLCDTPWLARSVSARAKRHE